jgi:hypothetical protein
LVSGPLLRVDFVGYRARTRIYGAQIFCCFYRLYTSYINARVLTMKFSKDTERALAGLGDMGAAQWREMYDRSGPPAIALKRWFCPRWLFAIALRRRWSLFYQAWPK